MPVQSGQRGRARGGFLEEAVLELNLKTGGGVSPKGKHSGRGHQMCKGTEAWPREPYLWDSRKPLGLEPSGRKQLGEIKALPAMSC